MFFLLFFWGFNLALVGCKDTRRDENNPSGSGRLARVCVLARLYPGSGQWIRFFTLLICFTSGIDFKDSSFFQLSHTLLGCAERGTVQIARARYGLSD